jgi:sugar/nucleoside kinase (ribokinase family)
MVTPEGNNSIVVIPGANDALQPEELDPYLDELRSSSLILSQLEIPLPTCGSRWKRERTRSGSAEQLQEPSRVTTHW